MTRAQRSLLISSAMLAGVMQTIDTTIAIVALPHMQGAMSATPDQIAWVLTSYIVASAVAIPTTHYLSQRFGRKRLLLTIIAGFTISSVLCGASQSLEQIVFFRLLQGAFGAYFMPVGQTLILDFYTIEERPKMMGLWVMGAMVGPIIGPVLGGFITDSLSWRWVFYINIPFGLLSFIGISIVKMEREARQETSFSWQGFIYLALSLGILQLMLDRGNLKDWFSSTEICMEAIAIALFFYLFVTHSLTSRKPFLDFGLFRDSNFTVSMIVVFIGGALLFATMSLMPPFLQTLLGYPVHTTGLILAPRGVSSVVAIIIYSRIGNRVDPRFFLGSGILLCTVSLWQMQLFDLNTGPAEIIWSGIVQGFGLGLFFPPITILGFATLAKKYQGEAASLLSLVRNLGSSIGIAISQALFASWVQINHATLSEHIVPTNPIYRPEIISRAFNPDSSVGLALLDMEVSRQAAAIAYLNDFRLLMWLSAICLLSLLIIRFSRPEEAPSEQPPTPIME